MRRHWVIALMVSVLVSAAIPLWLGGGSQLLHALARFPLWGLVPLLTMVALGWLCNAFRLRILAGAFGLHLPVAEAFSKVLSIEFAGTATPAYTGGPATNVYLFTRRGLGVPEASALVVLDQIADLAFFATFLPLAALFVIGDVAMGWVITAGIVAPVGFALLLWLPRHYRVLALALGRIFRRVPMLHRYRWRLGRALLRFRAAVRLMLGLGRMRLAALYGFCTLHWLLRYALVPTIFMLLDNPLPWAWLFITQALSLMVGHLSLLPGGSVGVEVGFGMMLSAWVDASVLAVALLVWRFCTFHWYLIAGAPAFLLTVGRGVLGRRMAY
ncbi:hypothetical protein KBTX_01128 [wastewater metagenome]|uniref:Lysylphosphatidylglycerol synthase TM region n=3 Tax=root TaxID=1 RepID=A0A5B8R6Z3_9ZZZZ|nr:lysylphosphatidylglycerol synthase transmembrane domain-containing protein [Arhodomonas aquaeolei]MCS4505913.1 flippase-like domain-containing protein [Arhodomonas aquaeolei]QEA04819.1 hypothetical protein KBTEX_01128 [uncultured organism]